MTRRSLSDRRRRLLAPMVGGLLAAVVVLIASPVLGHPLGNFSINHYTGLRVTTSTVELRYIIDRAEIPTFQELQEAGLRPDPELPGVRAYATRQAETLKDGLILEQNGRRLALETRATEILFVEGAGGLPTMKLGVDYRATLDQVGRGARELVYRDRNFAERAGWKEIVAGPGAGVTFVETTVPERDRSRQLSDYPTDLLNSPPQAVEARVVFTDIGPPAGADVVASGPSSSSASATPSLASPALEPSASTPPAPGTAASTRRTAAETSARIRVSNAGLLDRRGDSASPSVAQQSPMPIDGRPVVPAMEPRGSATAQPGRAPIGLRPNERSTPRDTFTDLIATSQSGFGPLLVALVVAAGLGAFHALEPGHGKTVVAAYLVGARGTATHAVLLGLIVTAAHTAGVYLLGAVTLYASRSLVADGLYPWIGALSGLTIATLGLVLFLQRYSGAARGHGHAHSHGHEHGPNDGHAHLPEDGRAHSHEHGSHAHADGHGHHHHHVPDGQVSVRQLLALGVSGGIVPCPAALVVLLSALALGRVGFGLVLIVVFSLGLATVLIVIGVLMVHARRLMSRWRSDGPMITRWLPLTSSAVITMLGLMIAAQALVSGGIIPGRL